MMKIKSLKLIFLIGLFTGAIIAGVLVSVLSKTQNTFNEVIVLDDTKPGFSSEPGSRSNCPKSNQGFLGLKRLYVTLNGEEVLDEYSEILQIDKFKEIFKNKFSSFDVIFLPSRFSIEDIKDEAKYAFISIHFSVIDWKNYDANNKNQFLVIYMTQRRSDKLYIKKPDRLFVPLDLNSDGLLKWYKESVMTVLYFISNPPYSSCH